MKKIVLASKNLDKVKEMRLALQDLPVEILSLADFSEARLPFLIPNS